MESSRKRGPERLAAGARALLGSLALAVALLAVPASALAAQTESGTCDGKLIVTVQGTQGGGSGSGEQGGQSGSPETGEPGVAAAALAAAAGLALAAAGALVVARSRAAAGHAAETGLPAGASLPLAAAIGLALAAALLFGLSARSALADEDASVQRAAVSATVTVDASGNVVSSEVTFSNQSSSRLTVTGVSVPELGGAIASTIDGLQVARGTQARGALSVTSVPAELVAKAKAAGGTVEVDMSADFTYESFNVTFESNGGSGVATQKVAEGEATPEPVAPTREGYDFKGWYADEALATPYDFSAPVEADATAYAKWETSTYQVTYMSNGEQYFEETVEHGSTVCGPDNAPERDGYLFLGWYADEAFETLFDYRAPITSDTTVYAKWEVNTYPVRFDTDGGTKVDEQVVEYGSTATDPAEQPTKVGYTFAGWYSDAAHTQTYDFSTPITTPITLYAAWQVKTFTVTFHAGEHGSNLTQSVTYGEAASEPTLSATGYHVTGWYADAELTQPYDFSATVTADLDLYAKWEINTYTVTFDAAGGSEVASQTVTHGDKAAEPVAPTKEGYLFKGWYYDEDATVEVDFDIAVNSDATYHAKWVDAVTVSYDLGYEDAPAVEASLIDKGTALGDKLPAPTRAGYTFDGWFADGSDTAATAETTFDASTKLTAKWTARTDTTYTVTYHFSPRVEGGEDVVGALPYTGTTGEMTNINMPATLFGFILAKDVVQQEIKGDGSTNVDVYYDREEYAVTFYQEQGDATPLSTDRVRFLGPLSSVKPADPTRDDYNFLGWYRLSPNGDGTYSKVYVSWETDTMSYYPEKDYPNGLCLYADWELSEGKATYTVNHVFEKADGNTTTESYVLTGTVGEKTAAEARDFEGYSVQPFEQEEIKDGGATTVTIEYKLKRGTVTFDANGHGENKVVEKVAYGADLTGLAPTLSADGYDFGGWYTDEECEKSFDFASSSMGASDLTLYAKWTARTDTKYTVRHLQQNVEGDGYTLVETETLTGTTGENTAAAAKSYTGFDEPTFSQVAIAGDGSTVVDVKYDRKAIEVTLWEDSTTKYETRTVRYGATLTDPGWEMDGCYIDSLTYNNGAGLTGTFDFSMPIDETVLGDKTKVLITGRWKQYADSYWIAPASSITTSNSSVQVANANYTNPETGIIKDRRQIQTDVEKIAAGDAATIAEYTEYMTSDTYHLYTKVGTGTSTNDYAEFRIIQVGSHDGDGSALTFQATSATDRSCMNDSATNDGGWATSWLHNSMNNTWGSTYQKYAAALTDDMMAVAKQTLSPKSTSWVYAQELTTTFDKMWLPSWSEVYGADSAETLTYASRNAFTSQYAYEGSQYAYYGAVGVSSGTGNEANPALDPLTKFRDGSDGEGSLLRSAAIESGDTYCQIAFSGTGRDSDTTRPGRAGAAAMKRVAPCFSFGTSTKRAVSFVTNGGSAVAAQQVVNGSAVTEATTTRDGHEFVGWYTDASLTQPYVLGTTPVTADTVLYARWTEAESSVTDSYWLADSYKYTNGNSEAAVNAIYNADCELNPQGYVVKDRAQFLFDVSKLYAGDEATSVEYTYYMLTDTVHLYTKTRSEGTADDFNEFRIVNVGRHDNENGIISFQMSTANYNDRAMSEPDWYTTWAYKTSDMNKYLSRNAGSDIGEKLYSEIRTVNKTFTSCTRDSEGFSKGVVTESGRTKMWLASLSEFGGNYDSVHNSEGSQYQYFKWHGATNVEVGYFTDANGTIAQLNYSRSGYYMGYSKYGMWTRSVCSSTWIGGGNDSKTYFAYDELGRIDYDACHDYALTSKKLAYSPCFCF